MFRLIAVVCILAGLEPVALAGDPDCTGTDRWPTTMAFVQLKNAGLTGHDRVVLKETKTKRLASEKVGKDLYRQVHLVKFTHKDGKTLEVITVNDANSDECSASKVEVYLVTKKL